MEVFEIKEDGIKSMMKDLYVTGGLATTVLSIFIFAQIYFRSHGTVNATLIVVCSVVLGTMLTIGFSIAIAKTRRTFESFSLTFDGQLITREEYDTPTVTLLRNEITEITKYKKGNFKIKGGSKYDVILIPKQIANAHKLEELLKQIVPITEKVRETSVVTSVAMIGGIIAFFTLFETTKNKLIIGACAALLLGATIYHFLDTQKSRNIDYRAKTTIWLTIFAIISIGLRVYRRLTS